MADRLRTFIAIDVPAAPFRAVLTNIREMGRPVKAAGEPLHLTLKFLGETELGAVAEIARRISEVAAVHATFALQLCGIGAFPRIDRPSVIWAGVAPLEPVAALAEDLEACLEPLGFPRESRPFHAHITLARVKGRPPQELAGLFDPEASLGEMTVTELRFYQSRLTPAGPEYSALSTALLRHPV